MNDTYRTSSNDLEWDWLASQPFRAYNPLQSYDYHSIIALSGQTMGQIKTIKDIIPAYCDKELSMRVKWGSDARFSY